MNSLFRKLSNIPLILYFSFFVVFSSCASRKDTVPHPNLEAPRQHYFQGDLQKAIEGYNAALEKYPDEPVVAENYSQVLEEIRQSADEAFQSENFALAGRRYSLLLSNYPLFQTLEKMLSFGPQYLGHRIKDCLTARGKTQIQDAFDPHDYVDAVEAYSLAIQAFPEENSLREDLIESLSDLHRRGEKALEEKGFAQAGKMYSFLLDVNQKLKDPEMSIPFSKESLEEGIKQCRIQLTRKGLKLYREKKLKEAISVWKSILEFDPENPEIEKAIANAEEQLKKIKK